MKQVKIAVIGGGAAGIMAAISAAKNGANVTVLEATKRVGNKILLTGNGKCNFSNLFMDESCYYCKDNSFLKSFFEKFPPEKTWGFFENAGMLVKNKNGYLYPAGEQASIVLDILRLELKQTGVSIVTEAKVVKILKNNDVFYVETENGKKYHYDKVIITTGGRAYPKTGSDGSGYKLAKKLGHSIVPTVPALVQLVGSDNFYKIIAGVRSEGSVKLFIDGKGIRTEHGEIQFTDYGISGIPVFQISRQASYGLLDKKEVTLYTDVLSDIDTDGIKGLVQFRRTLHRNNTLEEFMCGIANKKLCLLAIKMAGKKPEDTVKETSEDMLYNMVLFLKNIRFHIVDTKGYDMAQVTAGGVNILELDENLQSKCTENLYFAGEIIDVDGICGGYNLQWAFASGYIAGYMAAKEKVEQI